MERGGKRQGGKEEERQREKKKEFIRTQRPGVRRGKKLKGDVIAGKTIGREEKFAQHADA